MAQADQTVQNATFPTVRADINNNLAALFSDNSGNTAPSVTVAFQDWIDTSGTDPLWKKRNAANNAWITLGTINGNLIAFEGTLPDQSGNSGKYLSTDGAIASWAVLAFGVTVQTFTSSGTYTPTAGKTSFLVFATGGGGGSAGNGGFFSGSGGGGGTAVRMYTSTEMGSSADVTIGAGGTAGGASSGSGGTGGSTIFDPSGSGLTITGVGGGGSPRVTTSANASAGASGGATDSQYDISGSKGINGINAGGVAGGTSFWAGGIGKGGDGPLFGAGNAGTAGGVFILEF